MLFAYRRSHPLIEAGARRIAVLPFVNLDRAGDEYFAEGITDELRGKLAALPGMQVIARSSSSQYAQTPAPGVSGSSCVLPDGAGLAADCTQKRRRLNAPTR